MDFNDLRKNFGVSEKKVILKDDRGILTGLLLDDDAKLMTDKQLDDYSSYLKNNNYEKIFRRQLQIDDIWC